MVQQLLPLGHQQLWRLVLNSLRLALCSSARLPHSATTTLRCLCLCRQTLFPILSRCTSKLIICQWNAPLSLLLMTARRQASSATHAPRGPRRRPRPPHPHQHQLFSRTRAYKRTSNRECAQHRSGRRAMSSRAMSSCVC